MFLPYIQVVLKGKFVEFHVLVVKCHELTYCHFYLMTEVYFFQQHAILIFFSQSKDEISDFKNALKYTNIFSESHKFLL